METNLVYALSAVLVVREIYHLYAMHKMVNKLMSRNYGEYIQSEMIKKVKMGPPMTLDDAANIELEQQIGSLSGIS